MNSEITKIAEKNMYDTILLNNELYNHFIRSNEDNDHFLFSPNPTHLYSSLLEELVEDDCHTRESFSMCLRRVILQLKTVKFN